MNLRSILFRNRAQLCGQKSGGKICLGAFLLFAAVLPSFGEYACFESFLERDNLWATTPDSFLTNPRDGSFFGWLSANKDSARYPAYRNSPEMTFLGKKCWETVVKFDGGQLSDVTISLYNRGEAGNIRDKKQFQTMLEEIFQNIDKWTGEKGVAQPSIRLANGMKLEKKAWVRQGHLVLELRWSASEKFRVEGQINPQASMQVKFRAEYIQLAVTKFDPNNDPRKPPSPVFTKPAKVTAARDIKANVKKDADGSIWIDNIPMVDQGQKGYCVAATTQRILEYYGTDVDQHVIAQVADSSRSEGTSPDKMVAVLKTLGFKFGVKVKVLTELNVQKFVAFVNDYNYFAKKRKAEAIALGPVINVPGVYLAMDPEALKEARCIKNKAGLRGFISDVTKQVDAGIPLAWSVVLGVVAENPTLRQAAGGHMRIISGYNKDRNEVVYSDSWGAGHDRKTMSFDDAWTITIGLFSFEPRK